MKSLIIKSILVFVVCILVYTVIIKTTTISSYQAINQLDGNKIAQENFYFDDTNLKSHFIVGSSLSFRLKEENFPKEFCNLALAGSSSPTGLRLIKEKGVIPKFLLVETNIIGRSKGWSKSKTMGRSNTFFSKEEILIKNTFEVTQKKNQPVSFFINYALQLFSLNRKREDGFVSEKAKKLMVENVRKEYEMDIEADTLMPYALESFVNYILYFQSQGTCIVLMEMPISCEVQTSTKAKGMRKLMKKYLPEDDFIYLNQLDCSSISTTDGTHLNEKSAKVMIDHILKELDNKKCS